MNRMIFVNLPVNDLETSKAFYTGLGFAVNEQFSDESGACVVVSEHIFVMVMTPEKFAGFSPKPVGDPAATASAILALSADDRAGVDALAEKALAAGGTASLPPTDHGSMYGRSFQDPDGHLWEVVWMDLG